MCQPILGRGNTLICPAIAFYFAEKKHGSKKAKEKMALLVEYFHIADCSKLEVMQALQGNRVKDFEDGLQYYASRNAICSCIVTEDTNDYHFAIASIFAAEDFLKRYAKARK